MTTDPLGDFFRDINHRIDLHKSVVSATDASVAMNVGDLYKQWLRDVHQRRELQLLMEQNRRLRAELAMAVETGAPAPPTAEEWESLRAFAPGLVELIESAKPVVARDRVVPMKVVPAEELIAPMPTRCGKHRIDSLGTTFTCDRDAAHDVPHRQPTTMARMGHEWADDNCGVTAGAPPLAHFACALPADHGGPYHAAVSAPGEKYCWIATHEGAHVMTDGWEPGRWYRVCRPDGTLWMETSSRREAQAEAEKTGWPLERLYVKTRYEWRCEQPEATP